MSYVFWNMLLLAAQFEPRRISDIASVAISFASDDSAQLHDLAERLEICLAIVSLCYGALPFLTGGNN